VKKKIIFILGSGRCGTLAFYQALQKVKKVEAYHEFFFEPTLRAATLYHMKKKNKEHIKKFIEENHLFSIKNSKKKIWIDSSNALPWIADVLVDMFPNAKFIHLIRNGKKVVSSFFYKHGDIMYNDYHVKKLLSFLKNKTKIISSEKKYWRPLPIHNELELNKFIKNGQFYRICKYWAEINEKISKSLKNAKFKKTFKLEDIENKKKLLEFGNFIGLDRKDYLNFKSSLSKPTNVTIPKNFYFTKDQKNIFEQTCSEQMLKFNYKNNEAKEYKTIY
jgi:hypothetical protein